MDFDDSPEEAAIRADAVAWLDQNAERLNLESLDGTRTFREHDAESDQRALIDGQKWQRRKADAGWAAPAWPVEHGGRGLPPLLANIFAQEEQHYDVPARMFSVGVDMAAPTIMEWGTEQQQKNHLQPTLTAQHIWCQLFSEPDAGSDLASLGTRAVLDGDEWVVTGQKVWTSAAHHATHGILLVRTNPEVPKHSGITALIVDMSSPNITVLPLRQIDGAIHFNEVFFDEVRIPVEDTLGPINSGWAVAHTMLNHERSSIAGGAMYSFGHIKALAQDFRRSGDPIIRQELATLYTRYEILKYLGFRVRTAVARGENPGPESSVMKLAVSALYEHGGNLMLSLEGAAGSLTHNDAPYDGVFQDFFMGQWAPRIGGGTDQIQRNIIGERVLGLPSEPRVDKNVAFNELKNLHNR